MATAGEFHDFSVKSELFNFCLEVEEREFWVPKEILAAMSPVLEKLLTDESFKEAHEGRARLTEKKADDILTFLQCSLQIYPYHKKRIDGTNLLPVW